ncbi:MAG: helix-turn-helix domain-containing protein [Gammaproteobacteria bacterium]
MSDENNEQPEYIYQPASHTEGSAAFLRQAMKGRDKNIVDVAKDAGVNKPAVYRWLNQERIIQDSSLLQLAAAWNLDPALLRYGRPAMDTQLLSECFEYTQRTTQDLHGTLTFDRLVRLSLMFYGEALLTGNGVDNPRNKAWIALVASTNSASDATTKNGSEDG